MKFTHAIVRKPCRNMIHGITKAELGKPDFEKAMLQHQKYIEALEFCGAKVRVLEADEQFPDSVFVEDTAVVTDKFAVITRPGAESRKREVENMALVLKDIFSEIHTIDAPGTLDGGDVMQVGTHFYIGLSDRTNRDGAEQLIRIAEKYGMSGETVDMNTVLHLKTGVVYLEDNTIVVSGEFIDKPQFVRFRKIVVDSDESYAANCIRFNENVIVPSGFPKIKAKIEAAGFKSIELDMSEFQKLDGGLSCLSLRF